MNIHLVQDSDWGNFFDIYDHSSLERYWAFESQAGWAMHNFDYDFDKADEIHDKNCISIKNQGGTTIVDKGKIPYAFDLFSLDEWTYLVGFKSTGSDLPKIAALVKKYINEPDKLYELLPDNGIIWICHIDGWWEVWSESAELPKCVNPNLKNIKIEKSCFFGSKGSEKEYYDDISKLNG